MQALLETALDRLDPKRTQWWVWPMTGGLALTFALAILHLPVPVQLGLLVGTFGVAAVFARPREAVFAFLLVRIVMDLFWWLPGRVAGLSILALATGTMAAVCGALLLTHVRRLDRHPATTPMALIVFLALVAMGRSGDPAAAVELFARFVSPFLMLLLLTMYLDDRRSRKLLTLGIGLMTLIPLASSLFHLANGQMSKFALQGYGRLHGGYHNLRNHAFVMGFIVMLGALGWFSFKDKRARLLSLAAGGLGALCLYLTYIRSAQLGLAAFLAVYLFTRRRLGALAMGVTAVVVLFAVSETMRDRFVDIALFFDPTHFRADPRTFGSFRWGLWTYSFAEFIQQPWGDMILGLGIGGHNELTIKAYNPYLGRTAVDTHSDFLGLMYQLGPIALLAYLYLIGRVGMLGAWMAQAGRSRFARELGGFMAGFAALALVTNTISNGFVTRVTQAWMFWGMAGILYAEYLQHQRERANVVPLPHLDDPEPRPA